MKTVKLPESPEERTKLLKASDEFKTINGMEKKKLDDALLSHELTGPLHSFLKKGFSKDEIQSAAVGSIKGDQRVFDAMNVVFAELKLRQSKINLLLKKKRLKLNLRKKKLVARLI